MLGVDRAPATYLVRTRMIRLSSFCELAADYLLNTR